MIGLISVVAMLTAGPIGLCLAVGALVVQGLKIAKVDAELVKAGKVPASQALIEKWLDRRAAKGAKPTKPAKFGMWRYAWQRWQALWEDLSERHQQTRAAYKKACADARGAGRPLPPKPTFKETLTGWKWEIDQLSAPQPTEPTKGDAVTEPTVKAGSKPAPDTQKPVDPAAKLATMIKDARPAWPTSGHCGKCGTDGPITVFGDCESCVEKAGHGICAKCGELMIRDGDVLRHSEHQPCNAVAPSATITPESGPRNVGCRYPAEGGGKCGAETDVNRLYCNEHMAVVQAEPKRRCMVPNPSNGHGVCGLLAVPGTNFCVHHQDSDTTVTAMPADDPRWLCPHPTADGVCGATPPWTARYCLAHQAPVQQATNPSQPSEHCTDTQSAGQPTVGDTNEQQGDTMTQPAPQMSGEVTGTRSAARYAEAVAAAHANHAGAEGYLTSLANMEIGDTRIGQARAAMEASRNAGAMWAQLAADIEKDNANLREQYANSPEAANKQANINE